MPKACSYHENGRQCPYDGKGTPPLCNAHKILLDGAATTKRSPFADLMSKVVSGKRVTQRDLGEVVGDLIGNRGVEDFVRKHGLDPREVSDAWRRAVGQKQRRTQQSGPSHRQSASRPPPSPPPPPPPDPRTVKERWARKVMGFHQELIELSKGEIKKRHRELARKYHPDRKGGSTQKMQEINQAVDILLELVDN